MSWDIIIWTKENSVDYVPSVWSNTDKTLYKYPLNRSETKIRKAIYDCKDISLNYKWCEATALKCSVKNLKKAREFCLKGQYTSNISDDTDDENISPNKRKIIKRLLEEYEYDEEFLPLSKKHGTEERDVGLEKQLDSTNSSRQQGNTFKTPVPFKGTFSMRNENKGMLHFFFHFNVSKISN